MYRKRRLVFNALSFVPGLTSLTRVKRFMERRVLGTGGSDSARYCYSIWLRHLVLAAESGQRTSPRIVAELGPGDSLGTGLAALLSGAGRYYAFDVVAHADARRNEAVFDELLELFQRREPIPGDEEFPAASPRLADYSFPASLLTDERLSHCLDSARVDRIRRSLADCRSGDSLVQYRAPWFSEQIIERNSVDMIFSQAVLEHVDALREVYRNMHHWLAANGFMSHQIDLKSHGWAEEWNGHWAHSDLMWKLIRGKDSWFINREPASTHITLLKEEGFRILRTERNCRPSMLGRHDLAARFRSMPDDDIRTSGLFVQAVKA